MCGIDFILNVVLDEHKQIVHVVSGHPISAHRQGCNLLTSYTVKKLMGERTLFWYLKVAHRKT